MCKNVPLTKRVIIANRSMHKYISSKKFVFILNTALVYKYLNLGKAYLENRYINTSSIKNVKVNEVTFAK